MNRVTQRIAYKEAGLKLRLSRQRLAESDLHDIGRAWRVWAACVELTASYSKNAERTTVVEIAALAGIRADKVSPILREFDRLGVFTWRKEEGRRRAGLLVLPSNTPVGGSKIDPQAGPYLEVEEEPSGLEGPRGGTAPHPSSNGKQVEGYECLGCHRMAGWLAGGLCSDCLDIEDAR